MVSYSTLDGLVLLYCASGEVLPEVTPVSPPLLTVWHETEVRILA